jgi:hypothetical protein
LAAARTAHANAGRRVKALRPHMVDLARLASYLEVRERFKRERVRIMLAAVAAAVLLVCFAWAANPPAAAGNSAEAVAPKPSAGRLVLTPAGVTELGPVVGDACARRARSSGVAAVALAFDADVYDVLVLPGADCPRPVRVSVPTRLGNVVGDATVVLAPSPT